MLTFTIYLYVVATGFVDRVTRRLQPDERGQASAEYALVLLGAAAGSASSSLDPHRLAITVTGRGAAGSRVQVKATYGPPTGVPLVGEVVRGLRLEASATMRVER